MASPAGGAAPGPGTRPGIRSQRLISTGQAELDRILGGGLPLGNVFVILHDSFTPHHDTLLKCFVAEGLASNQAVHWACDGRSQGDPFNGLPRILMPSERSNEKESPEGADGSGLRIAWQYRRYIQEKQNEPQPPATKAGSAFKRRSATSSDGSAASSSKSSSIADWCHDFDISRPMKPTDDIRQRLERGAYSGEGSIPKLLKAAEELKARISSTAQRSQPLSPASSAAPSAAQQPAPTGARPMRRLLTSMSGRPTVGVGQPGAGMKHSTLQARMSGDGNDDSAARLLPAVGQAAGSQEAPREGKTGNTLGSLKASPGTPPVASGSAQRAGGEAETGRLAVRSLGSFHWVAATGSREAGGQILRALHCLKALARSCPMAVMVSIPSGIYGDSFAAKLQHLCDAAVSVEAVSNESDLTKIIPDPQSCCGTLRVLKLPASNTQAPLMPIPALYLIRHRRRRIKLEPFEVDPDAEAGITTEPSSGGGKQVPGMACRGPAGAPKPLDF